MNPASTLPRAGRGSLPGEYGRRSVGGVRLAVLDVADAWATNAVEAAGTLHEWAASQVDHRTFRGRGRVHSVPAPRPGPDGRARWAVRHYRRGGAVARHLGDRYLRFGWPRPFREIVASTTARLRGVRTPAAVAGAVYPAGLYYRCDLVTEVVPDAVTLADTVRDRSAPGGFPAAARVAGALVRELAQAGVHHVDMNAHNVLFEGGAPGLCWVVDLDRARVLDHPSTSAEGDMLARLTRSIMKIGDGGLDERDVLGVLRGEG